MERKRRTHEPRILASQIDVARFFDINPKTLQRHRDLLGHTLDGETMYDLNEVYVWLQQQRDARLRRKPYPSLRSAA